MRRLLFTIVPSLAFLLATVPAEAARTIEDLVALQQRAADAGPRHLDQALRDHAESLQIAQALGRPRLLAVVFHRLGQLLEDANIPQEPVIAYESGLKALAADARLDLRRELESLQTVAKSHMGGSSSVPADLYSEPLARELMAAEADPGLPVSLLLSIGNAYLRQAQPDPALNAYRRASQRQESAATPRLRGYALANSGEILRRQGKVADAERELTEALDLLRRHAPAVDRRRAVALLAGIYRDLGRRDEALAGYRDALLLYQQARDPRGEGRAHAGLGRLYLDDRRLADARVAYGRAVDLGEQVKDDELLWHAYWGRGQAERAAGDLVSAAQSLKRSLDLVLKGQQGLRTDEGKVTFLDSAHDVFDQLIALHLDRAASDPAGYRDALEIAEDARGRALLDLMGDRSRRRLHCPTATPAPASRADSAGAAPPRPRPHPATQAAPGVPSPDPMGRQDASGVVSSGAASDRLDAIRSLLRSQNSADAPRGTPGLEDRQSAIAGPVSSGPPPSPLARDLRCDRPSPPAPQRLGRLVFHVLGDRTVVLATGADGTVHGHVAPLGREAMTRRVDEIREALEVDAAGRGVVPDTALPGPSAADYRQHLRGLYADLIAPVADALPAGDLIVIEPHGPLWLLPFAALIAPDGSAVADRWPLLYAPSAEVLEEIRREPGYERPRDLKALIIGNPMPPGLTRADDERFRGRRLRATFQSLPGAEQEARTIAALLPESQRTLLLGANADLGSVQSGARDHTVLHLASHALAFPGSPLESFVMLAASGTTDGRLTARRVLDLDLAADLVTLSACQTGMGQLSGEGVIGLSRAFLVSGARSVLVSQWSVSDDATVALMEAFYRGYLAGTEDKARALQRAMREARARPGREHPRYWAPFVLIGSER